jgi:hypothetical protein
MKEQIDRSISRLVFTILLCTSGATFADDQSTYIAELVPTTGFNSDCDRPLFMLPAPLPPYAHFDFVGLYDPGREADDPTRDAQALVPDDCFSRLDQAIATTSNDTFRALNGFPEPDPRLKNLRRHEVPRIALPDGTRLTLPPHGVTPPPLPPTISLPAGPQTLGSHRAIKGQMKVRCRTDGTASVRIRAQGYEHNAVVTVFAIWLATPPGAPAPTLVPLPLGGANNLLAIGTNGVAEFNRELSYCPTEIQPNGDQLLIVDLVEHWDGSIYGAVPDLPFATARFQADPTDPSSVFESVIGAGIVTVTRGEFAMTVQPW